jgi:thioredoxin reductase
MTVYDYLIVGAGPAGLQMGAFLERAGRSYLILERADKPGAFFEVFPRHRMLLSINKRFNYFSEDEYNLRHDWNSLLSNDEQLRFANYSRDLYPSAADLRTYLTDFARRQALKIQYKSKVTRIAREDGRFRVTVADRQTYACNCLLIATGAVAPNVPQDIPGIEHCVGYEDHPLDLAKYENKRVAIVGAGNSAFEVANHLSGVASVIHLLMGRTARHAWQTHYVGDLRAINNTIIDMYQLKSLHATLGMQLTRVRQNADGTLTAEVAEPCPHWTNPGVIRSSFTYDYIIRCTGWKYVDETLFSEDCRPQLDAASKYPKLSVWWESSVPGMFFIGTSMAARDRRAASGFIHGFRYLIRTLHHRLEERYHDKRPRRELLPLETVEDLRRLSAEIVSRVSVSSALYQLNGFLADAIYIKDTGADFVREQPMEHCLAEASARGGDAILITLEYGFHRYPRSAPAIDFIRPSDPDQRECAAFIHPVLRYYRDGRLLGEHHLNEHFYVRYDITETVLGTPVDLRRPNENRIMNFLNSFLALTKEEFPESLLPPDVLARAWQPWTVSEADEYRARIAASEATDSQAPCRPS